MIEFLSVIFLIFGILQIILFFKVWGMTNNVSKMKCMMEMKIRKYDSEKNETKGKLVGDIKVGDLVVELKSERQLKVAAITNDEKYECKIAGTSTIAGVFCRDEIELFDRYWNKRR